MKILVTTIRFYQKNDGKRYLSFGLNNGTICAWQNSFGIPALVTQKESGRLTRTEKEIAYLVLGACRTYIDGGEPESMSYSECVFCRELATERFDWEDAGYDSAGTDDDKDITLFGYIANFQDI